MSEKSARKSAKPGKPFKKGGDPRQGRGPKPGAPNAGRPPNAWNERMEALADRWLIALEAGQVVDDDAHPHFEKVGKWLVEQLRGKAKQQVDVTSNGQTLESLLTASHKAAE
jgi:hypothetical protein